MINLKDIDYTPNVIKITYEVTHSSGLMATTLEQDFVVHVDQRTGAVTGEMHLKNMNPVGSVDEARLKMAEWLERMAIAMRTPMSMKVAVPTFEPVHSFYLRPDEKIVFDQVWGIIRSRFEEEQKIEPSKTEDDMEDHLYAITKEEVEKLRSGGSTLAMIPGIRDEFLKLALKSIKKDDNKN